MKIWLRDPKKGQERFGLRSIEFGNWLNEYERQTYLYGSMKGLDDLARILGVPRRLMGMGGRLSLALGARGNMDANAHYERYEYVVINLAYSNSTEIEKTEFPEFGIKGIDPMKKGKRRGKGSLAHEYAHALDNLLAILGRKGRDLNFLSGGRSTTHKFNNKTRGIRFTFEELFYTLYWNDDGTRTEFGKFLQKLKNEHGSYGSYLNRRAEVWARTFETWVSYRLAELKIKNGWLAKPLSFLTSTKMYPTRTAIKDVEPIVRELVDEAF